MTGWPVGFLSYQVHAEDKKEHTVEILFDVDMEWMFGRRKIDSWVEQEWRFVKSDSLYLGLTADGTSFSCDDSHVVLNLNFRPAYRPDTGFTYQDFTSAPPATATEPTHITKYTRPAGNVF
jgi:hypothetical protein